MLTGSHKIEVHRIQDGSRFVLNGKWCTKLCENYKFTDDWNVSYREDATQKTYNVSPYVLVKWGNK